MSLVTFQHLSELQIVKDFYDLVWRLFGIKIVMRSCDGETRIVMGNLPSRSSFCTALRKQSAGEKLCEECDRIHVKQAMSQKWQLSYRCHVGMMEFAVPIFLEKEIIAFLVCGQILSYKPERADWLKVKESLDKAGVNTENLENLFFKTTVIAPSTQEDLMVQLQLFGNYVAYSQSQMLLIQENQSTQIVRRAQSYIRNHFSKPIALQDVAKAAYTSARNLRRVFRMETGKTVWEFIHTVRIDYACEQMRLTDKNCNQIAFESGFGTVQQFNTVFKKLTYETPSEWRKN